MHGGDGARLAAALLAEGRAVRLVARGASMAPFIRDGEEVLLEPLAGPPVPGEVVLGRGPAGRLALHRVVRCTERGIVIRGDAAGAADPLVAAAEVLGRATAVSGRRRLHLQAPFGRLVLAGLGLRRLRLVSGPLRPLARLARLVVARIP